MSDTAAPDSLVLVADDGPVRTLTLNRPQALNSFTVAMHEALAASLDAARADEGVRCVVITGAGRGFCAGQDLSDPAVAPRLEPGAEQPDIGALIERTYRPLVNRLQAMPVPVIARVNGVAAGAGANLALACDLVIAARSASFIQAFSKIGLIPDCGGTWLLPRGVGRARAMALAMLGEKLAAEQAAAWGLIWQCVDDAALDDTVGTLAARLAAMPMKALAATRAAIDAADGLSLDEAMAREARVQAELGRSADFLEGVSAFFARRPAVFRER